MPPESGCQGTPDNTGNAPTNKNTTTATYATAIHLFRISFLNNQVINKTTNGTEGK